MTDEKKPSGAQNRKRQKQNAEKARRDEELRRQSVGGEIPLRLQLKPPPIGDPLAGVAWAHDAACALLWEVLNDPIIDAEKRWRFGSDLVGQIGKTHAKANMQVRLAKIVKPDNDPEGVNGRLEPNPLAGTDT